MALNSSPYTLLHNNNLKDIDSNEGRRISARAGCRISSYQFEKLKFLSCSILQKCAVKDSVSVLDIYQLLESHYFGNGTEATTTLCNMLEIIGLKPNSSSSKYSSSSDILANEVFMWRVKVIGSADTLRKQKRPLQDIRRVFGLEMSMEDFSSPVMLFDHLIENGKLKVGEDEDFAKVENVISNFGKLINKSHWVRNMQPSICFTV